MLFHFHDHGQGMYQESACKHINISQVLQCQDYCPQKKLTFSLNAETEEYYVCQSEDDKD